jgi:hypothetical protein
MQENRLEIQTRAVHFDQTTVIKKFSEPIGFFSLFCKKANKEIKITLFHFAANNQK